MVAQVGKTSLILSLVSEEFPEEVSCPNLSLTHLLTLRLTIVNQFLFTFRSMFNLYISFEINVLRIIYLAVTVLCNLLWHSLTTPLPAHHLVRDNNIIIPLWSYCNVHSKTKNTFHSIEDCPVSRSRGFSL